LRILLGAVIVLLCAAGGSAVFVVEQVQSVSDALRQNRSLKVGNNVLANAAYGGPETLLLVGDDTRKGFKYYQGFVPDLANEMLLVRLDPNEPYITMMSIPRELMATIYNTNGQVVYVNGLPQNRLNSAYTNGIGSLVKTIYLNYGLSINHVLVATFHSFKNAVNEMGCVYSTVDERYYNDNVGTPGTDYQSINLQPGYQKLCGEQALEFVSYRHTDTSLVRDARDQSFLLDVKKEFGPTLIDNEGKFVQIFGRAVVTDASLKSNTQILSLLDTLINMSSRSVRDVQFQVNLQPTGSNPCSCDTATPQQIQYSVYEFLHGGKGPPTKNAAQAQAQAVHSKHGAAQLPLVPTQSSAMAQARAAAAKMPFPLEYPQVEDRGGSVQAPDLRVYDISGPGGVAYPAYVGVFYDGGLGNYYDVQGTTWTTAPQFDSPDQTVKVGQRTYYLFYESSNLKMVAWYEHDAVYWVRNSLTNSVPNGEMLAIAEQTQPFITTSGGSHPTPLILHAARVPFPTTAKKPINTKLMVGGAAGLATLIALPLLLFLGIRRFLDLRRARFQLASGEAIGDRMPVDPGVAEGPSPVPLLAPFVFPRREFAGDLPPGIPPRLEGSVRWVGTPTVYRRWSLRSPRLILSMLVVLALVGGGVAAYVLTRHQSAAAPIHHVKRVTVPLVPTVPVVVLNDTTLAGAAHRLAVSLEADRIKVPLVANVSETLPPGNEILYATGQQAQAERLAKLLGKQVATRPAPIDPVVAAAAGNGAQLVVVIT
jgi:polyisoprenyl-teichoic acid--peptidoglycan teichoic acid transferase